MKLQDILYENATAFKYFTNKEKEKWNEADYNEIIEAFTEHYENLEGDLTYDYSHNAGMGGAGDADPEITNIEATLELDDLDVSDFKDYNLSKDEIIKFVYEAFSEETIEVDFNGIYKTITDGDIKKVTVTGGKISVELSEIEIDAGDIFDSNTDYWE